MSAAGAIASAGHTAAQIMQHVRQTPCLARSSTFADAQRLLLRAPVDELATLYTSQYRLSSLAWWEGLSLVGAGGLLGVIGAALAVNRHLRGIVPD